MLSRKFFLFLLLIAFSQTIMAQRRPVVEFEKVDFTKEDSLQLLKEFAKNKTFISSFTLQSLIALSYYPGLKNTHIRFKYKPAHSPLTTRPTFPSVLFGKSNRRFTITVSDSTVAALQPILLKQMDFNTQIGVIGH